MSKEFTLALDDGSQYPYSVVRSKRAKYIRIKLSRLGELSVTLPTLVSINHAHEFVQTKRNWIENNLKKITRQAKKLIPESLNLRLLDEYWTIHYEESKIIEDIDLIEKNQSQLNLVGASGNLKNTSVVAKKLNTWCKKKAIKVFPGMLQELAELHGFHYRRLSIRAQKTRWGSCTQDKNINLNCKLLFMPEEVVRYVMIHELCHTIEMNHSSRFWALVEECDPDYKVHKRLLKTYGSEVVI